MVNTKNTTFSKSPLKRMYKLLNASQSSELFSKYLVYDQKIVTSRIPDYHDQKLLINKVRNILENVDARFLSKKEKIERREILWLWYHHAISYAVWGYKDRKSAEKYSSLALKYKTKDNPNKITRLLYLLVRDKLSEASKWVRTIKDKSEKKTALKLLIFYKEGGFFK